jgi:hypothetical protein
MIIMAGLHAFNKNDVCTRCGQQQGNTSTLCDGSLNEDTSLEPIRTNIWEDNMGEQHPPIEYKDLQDVIDFTGFKHDMYRTGEQAILQPQLEALGYTHIKWSMGEEDSFGPLTRVCMARDKNGVVSWFVYG